MSVPVIAIDGPSGSGKGTVCRIITERLGWHLLDSGALYRLTALAGAARGDMLILAPATSAEVRALGSHTLRRCFNDLDQFRPCKTLFHLGDFSLNHFAERDERDEDYEILVAGDTLAAKGDVVDADGYPVTEDQIHRVRIRRIQAATKLFQQETPSCCAVQFRSTLKLWLWRKTSLME